MNNLKIVEFYEDEESETYHIERINNKLPWPSNSNVAVFVMKGKKLEKYKILSTGRDDRIVVIKKRKEK